MKIDWANIHRIHFVGIKGIAMAALAVWAKERGYVVSGSDIEEEFPSDEVLKIAHISVETSFQKDHIIEGNKPDLVIYTGAHQGVSNIEVQTAKSIGIPVLPHGKALGLIMEGHRQVSVAGCHGKTTTSSMIATILTSAQKDPSYAIGCGEIRGLGLPGHSGHGEFFVAEADEYITDPTHDPTPRFLWQHPEVLVITNIDYDHPDAYANIQEVQDAFVRLAKQQRGAKITIINADDKISAPIYTIQDNTTLSFGVSPQADYRISRIRFADEKTCFSLEKKGKLLSTFTLNVPGVCNIHNAAASAIACHVVGLSWEQIVKGLAKFGGSKRRFEKIGFVNGALVYDDYAHHPQEIMATLQAARAWYPKQRIIAIFQPHTYSRTRALIHDFAVSFADASIVLLTDIYASARESETLGITGETLVSKVAKHHTNVHYTPQYADVEKFLHKTIHTGDIILFIGAGNIYSWSRAFVNSLI